MKEKKRVDQRPPTGTEKVAMSTGQTMTNDLEQKLEIVVKCDLDGSIDAVEYGVSSIEVPQVAIRVIDTGVGPISKSDLVMALTGSKLVVGFNVGLMPKLEQFMKDNGIEVRLYKVIYRLIEDLEKIARSLVASEPAEKITARAHVIALFKSSRKGSILGCEVQEGTLRVGAHFQIISAMGPIYSGKIKSLQIENEPVKQAEVGQQVGIKIPDFDKARVGDFIECREAVRAKETTGWRPRGDIIHPYS